MPVHPTPEQIQALAASTDTGPIVMLNLLRFKLAMADGIDEGVSGAEGGLVSYSVAAEHFLRSLGGRLINAVAVQDSVIGPDEPEWDLVLLVEYPSRQKFLEMATNPEYLKAHAHRDAALADSRLILCSSIDASALPDLA